MKPFYYNSSDTSSSTSVNRLNQQLNACTHNGVRLRSLKYDQKCHFSAAVAVILSMRLAPHCFFSSTKAQFSQKSEARHE